MYVKILRLEYAVSRKKFRAPQESRAVRLHCVVKWKLNSLFAGVAELAVFERARPVDEEAKFKKAPRSKFIGVTTP